MPGSVLPTGRRAFCYSGDVGESGRTGGPVAAAGLERIRSVLAPHNALEEEPDGLYETCDRLLASEAAALLEGLRAFPAIPLAPHQDGPRVERHIAETLALARKGRSSD